MKNKNIMQLLENHVDKIVLSVYTLVGLFLLWTYVISNPYGEKVRLGRGGKLGPKDIDIVTKKALDDSISGLDGPAEIIPPHRPYLSEYEKKLQSPLMKISSAVQIPTPGAGDVVVEEDREYALPEIPPLIEVAVGKLRGAAKVPTEEIGPDQLYASAPSEIEDIDLVTISARLSVQTLYNNFQQSFAGPRLKTSWKDARLATPVFARVEVQRRTQLDDDQWGQWESLSPTAIDPYRKRLEDLPVLLDDSPFGVDLWKAQYEPKEVQHSILQPEAYSFTVSRLDWMPPEFLDEALTIMKKQEQEAEREKQEALRKRRETATKSTNTRRTPNRRPQPRDRRNPNTMINPLEDTRTLRAAARKERDADDVRGDFDKQLLNDKSNIATMRDALLVWAHDDSAVPGETYQYRIRLGVFNPIAGKDWFTDEQTDYKNQLVLWSDFSEPTEEMSVPKRIYVFPMEVIADKEAPSDVQGVQVEVAKYYLGQWRDFEFDVYPGEIIGYEVEDVDKGSDQQEMAEAYQQMMGDMGMMQEPDTVDFTSDMTFVDIAKEVIWGSRLRPGSLYKMLYYGPEKELRKVAVGKSNWDVDSRRIYDDIQNAIALGVERRSPGMGRDRMSPDMMMPGMMPGMMPPGMMPPGMMPEEGGGGRPMK